MAPVQQSPQPALLNGFVVCAAHGLCMTKKLISRPGVLHSTILGPRTSSGIFTADMDIAYDDGTTGFADIMIMGAENAVGYDVNRTEYGAEAIFETAKFFGVDDWGDLAGRRMNFLFDGKLLAGFEHQGTGARLILDDLLEGRAL